MKKIAVLTQHPETESLLRQALGAEHTLIPAKSESQLLEHLNTADMVCIDPLLLMNLIDTKHSLLRELDKQEQKEETFKLFFQEILEKRFTNDRETIKNFSRILSASRDLDQLVHLSLVVLKDYLNVSRLAILLDEFSTGAFCVKAAFGMPEDLAKTVRLNSVRGLAYHLSRDGVVLRRSGSKSRYLLAKDPDVQREMDALKCEFAVPLFEKGKLLGILAGNNKVSGDPFGDSELEFLFSLGSQIAIAVENARLYSLLTYQKNYTESILSHITSGVITVNDKEKVITFNHKAEEILGMTAADVLEEDARRLPPPLADLLLETLKGERQYHRLEVRLPRNECLIGVSTSRLTGQNKEAVGSVMVFADLAQIVKQREIQRQEEHMAFVNKIAMRSSHELKNCLVSIRTFTQLLPDKYADKEFRTDFYTIVNHEVDRLTVLVDNLNFFAQPFDIRLSMENLEAVIEESLQLFSKADWNNIVLEKELLLNDSYMELDPEGMKKVFFNVVRNAIQAMPKGGKLSIKGSQLLDARDKTAEGGGQWVQIRVSDTGGGMTPEETQQAFDPFFTTKSRGIGLGLTIVKKIVEAHKGEVKLFSEPGRGTTVEITLPRRLVKTNPMQQEQSGLIYGATAKNFSH